MGIHGNEHADLAAKSALSQDILPFKIPYSDFKPLINVLLYDKWQSDWNEQVNNKLHSIKSVLGEWLPAFRSCRREEIVLARLRIGHTWLTHVYLLKGEEAPKCIRCFTQLSVQHILLECADFAPIRDIFFKAQSMRQL